jgi:hypothetical protein
MIEKSWKKMWTDHFERKYADAASRWADCRSDDRLVFCNVYRMILRALGSLPEDPDVLVKSAMVSKFHEEQEALDRILVVFKGR